MKTPPIRITKKGLLLFGALLSLVLLLLLEWQKDAIFGTVGPKKQLYSPVTSLVGSLLFLLLLLYASYSGILKPRKTGLQRRLLFLLPCLAVAVNNFPILPFLTGRAYIRGSAGEILFYFFTCLTTALFEELVFRGYVFMILLEKWHATTRAIFLSTVASSAIFGLSHLFNLFMGASPLNTLLQVGYSFLVGGMCAIVLLKTGSLWYAVLLHAIYNFAGGVVPTLGGGTIWDALTVTITVLLALAVAAYLLFTLSKAEPRDAVALLSTTE